MSTTAIVLVLLSSLLHAGWNGALKQAGDKRLFNAWMLFWCAVAAAPLAAWSLVRGEHLSPTAWLCAVATSLVWVIYYEAIAVAYEVGDLSLVYPVARGIAPLFTAVLALYSEPWPTALGWAGLALIAVSVWQIGLTGAGVGALRNRRLWTAAVLAGGTTAIYSLVDAVGVREGSTYLYQLAENSLCAVWLLALAWRRSGRSETIAFGRRQLGVVAASGLASASAYLLVLIAYTMAPTAYVVALRATSVLWSVLYGGLLLREPSTRRRLALGLLMLAGVVLLKVYGAAS